MPLRILLLFSLPALAAERTHTVVPEDYFSLATITEVAVSPDGKQVAFAEARWDKADDSRKGDVWVIATDGKSKPVRLTFDRANDRNLKWSIDSKTIYCLGNRKRAAEAKSPYDGKTQAWCIPASGGEPRAITREAGGIDHYDFAPKANSIFYSIEKTHHDDDDFAKLRNKYNLDYGGGVRKVSEIYRINLDDWRTDRVYSEKRYVREFAATQDGKRLAMVTAFDDTVVKSEGESRVDILTVNEPRASATGEVVTPPTDVYRKNAASPNAWLENLAWSPDGSNYAFTAVFDGYPAEIVIGSLSGSKWDCMVMPREKHFCVIGYGRGAGPPIQWVSNNQFLFLSELTNHGYIASFDLKEGYARDIFHVEPKLKDDHVYGYSMTSLGSGAWIRADSNEPAKLFVLNDGKQSTFDPNPHMQTWKVPHIEDVHWQTQDGSRAGGVLELPFGYERGSKKLPLVVAIHGGPTTSAKAALEFDPHNGRMYFSTAGYAVLCPNYRGSTGYGDKFVTDLIGRENDIEVKDIIAGVEHLVKEGIADPERVGVMGWSNGGYLTNCLITRKDLPFKLKAASSGAGIVDTVAEWGFNDEPAYPKVFKKGHPWETPEIYKKTSPTYDLGNIKTPTIIHVGGNDVRCPPGHSRMLYRAMKEYLNVPCELCEYPGEPHGLGKMTHRRAKMEWDLAWFNKYMK